MKSQRDIIVVGASAGGIGALKQLVSELPAGFPAAVFIVQHSAPDSPGLLAAILDARCPLPVVYPQDGQRFTSGHIYVAPPDHHLVLDEATVRVTHGPKENRFRPSIDVLFRSAAWRHGSRIIGVILTGSLDDGASGLYAIKQRGGMAVVQAPGDAEYPEMPNNALRLIEADEIVPLRQMAKLLGLLVLEPIDASGGSPMSDAELIRMEIEVGIALEDHALDHGVLSLGEPSLFTCPECHGVLLQIKEGTSSRFRCHTGHAYSLNSLLAEVTKALEDSLWSAVRTFDETHLLLTRLARHLREVGEDESADLVDQKIAEGKRRDQLVRQAVLTNEVISEDNLDDGGHAD